MGIPREKSRFEDRFTEEVIEWKIQGMLISKIMKPFFMKAV